MSPRAFSSANRSGSVPVSARTSDDLPWSTWPAVATTLTSSARRRCRAQRGDQRGVVGRVDGAQVADDARRRRPGRPRRAPAAARAASSASPASTRDADRRDRRGRAASRRRRPPRCRRPCAPATASAIGLGAVAQRRRPAVVAMRQSGIDGRVAGEVGRARRACSAASVELVGAHRARERVARRPRRPASAPPDDDAGLRAAEQLVAREGDEGGAGVERLADAGLVAQPRRPVAAARAWSRRAGPSRRRP